MNVRNSLAHIICVLTSILLLLRQFYKAHTYVVPLTKLACAPAILPGLAGESVEWIYSRIGSVRVQRSDGQRQTELLYATACINKLHDRMSHQKRLKSIAIRQNTCISSIPITATTTTTTHLLTCIFCPEKNNKILYMCRPNNNKFGCCRENRATRCVTRIVLRTNSHLKSIAICEWPSRSL